MFNKTGLSTDVPTLAKVSALVLLLASALPAIAFAQVVQTDDTASAVASGRQLSQELGTKQISCSQLTDSDYEHLGEYYMAAMMGSSHERMNEILKSRFGASGEEQMHITMGKRFSGCDTNAAYPAGFQGFAPMMGGYGGSMMGYDRSGYYDPAYGASMMNGYGYGGSMMGYGGFGFPFQILWWILVALAVVTVVRWFSGGPAQWGRGASALDVLNDRYAKGEINKEEFESKKKDLTL